MLQIDWKIYLLTFGLCVANLLGVAQQKYWIMFTDKGDISSYTPEMILSQPALENRLRQGIELDAYDYPVAQPYLNALQAKGITGVRTSRWFNAISAYLTENQIQELASESYIRSIRRVAGYARVSEVELDCEEVAPIDTFTRQLTMVGLDALHEQGYDGEGVRIAVFDNGFRNGSSLEAFSHIFDENRLIATRDYVEPGHDVFADCNGSCRHGTNVWSILAGDITGKLRGAAPGASFILLRTENDNSETHQEEDNWLAAAEYADSLGAQVFTTSLGYFNFDAGEGNYTQEDLDGNTAIITRAADMAASRGILVVNSAGNAGERGISPPADGDSVLAIGSVNQCEEYSLFSSHGPSADGQVKPDLTAMGEATFYSNSAGNVTRGNGTSYSAPIVAGLAACLIQANPNATAHNVYQALIRSADRYEAPDHLYGHGIPNGPTALGLLQEVQLADGVAGIVYPNPNGGSFQIALTDRNIEHAVRVELFDIAGRRVLGREFASGEGGNQLLLETQLPAGLYLLQVIDREEKRRLYQEKVLIQGEN